MELFHSASIHGDVLVDAPIYLILLLAIVLVYQGDMKNSMAIPAMMAAGALLFYPFHEYYLYSVYDIHTCHIMAGFMALPVFMAYTIYRAVEKQEGKKRFIITLTLGLFLVLCACSLDSLNLEQFKMYQGALQ